MTRPRATTLLQQALEQKLYAAQRDPAALPGASFTNASQTALYAPPVWVSARAGADQHVQYQSRGF
jgi:hypothetical protein